MEYALEHNGKGYLPSGGTPIPGDQVAQHNAEQEAAEIAWLHTSPDKLFLYVKHHDNGTWSITTWLGTKVSGACWVGQKKDFYGLAHSQRRAVDCTIFGVRYVGWHMESSGSYCRLRKAKRQ